MKSAKNIIKLFPPLYRFLSAIYQVGRHPITGLFERFTDFRGRYWKDLKNEDIRGYWDMRTDKVRNDYLLNILEKHAPTSMLEVGCNCGNKLYGLALSYPHARLTGIDINERAVKLGSIWLNDAGIDNVELIAGRAEDLTRFSDQSYDVVFSWAALIYPRPSEIRGILLNMSRIAKKAIVLLEVQSSHRMRRLNSAGVYFYGHWKRDYVGLLEELSPSLNKPVVVSIPKSVWSPGGGGGAIIEAQHNSSKRTTP